MNYRDLLGMINIFILEAIDFIKLKRKEKMKIINLFSA